MKTIVQTVTFAATPAQLFELYVDSKKHAASTGGEASIGRGEGDAFTAWDGYIEGRNLRLVRDSLIVQAWRSSDFRASDPDSVLVLRFEKKGKGTQVTMVHTNVPDREAKGLTAGWRDFYWKPWKAYLAATSGKKPARKK